MHHGIKGQKWGVRRYQNPDGSYTDLGQKRYRTGLNSAEQARVDTIGQIQRTQGKLAKAQMNNYGTEDTEQITKLKSKIDSYNKQLDDIKSETEQILASAEYNNYTVTSRNAKYVESKVKGSTVAATILGGPLAGIAVGAVSVATSPAGISGYDGTRYKVSKQYSY